MDQLKHIRDRGKQRQEQLNEHADGVEVKKAPGLPVMTADAIKQSCLDNDGFELPELNEKLYLHFKGYQRIENLEQYTGCKGLFLESNGFTKIENLEPVVETRSLFLQQNLIEKIENLCHLKELVVLDLSNNRITCLDGLSGLPKLNTLNVSKNQLKTIEDIEHLKECRTVRDLDVSSNKLEDFAILDVYAAMPALVAVKNNGNPVVSNTRYYRKEALLKLPNLRYLDRPIEQLERVAAKAWKEGGREAEIAARDANNRNERRERKESLATYHRWCKEMREKKDAEVQYTELNLQSRGPSH
jgi:dynein assembly factor 1